jgi:regulator of protease activity HflC (stomatin/prohibitin superfamily)
MCVGLSLVATPIAALMWGVPQYRIYNARCSGEAKLRQSESEKRILIEQAKAEVAAAELRADAIEAIGKAAKQYPEYRQQEFMGAFADALQQGNVHQIIYVPTEANVPIIEKGRN